MTGRNDAAGSYIGVLPTRANARGGAALASQITVVLNWFDEVRQRVPRK